MTKFRVGDKARVNDKYPHRAEINPEVTIIWAGLTVYPYEATGTHTDGEPFSYLFAEEELDRA